MVCPITQGDHSEQIATINETLQGAGHVIVTRCLLCMLAFFSARIVNSWNSLPDNIQLLMLALLMHLKHG